MKRKLVILLFMMLMVTGCSFNEKSKVLICSRNKIVSKDIKMELLYKVTYKGDHVSVIETEEKVISDDKKTLEDYKTKIEEMYSLYDNVEYYDYGVDISNNKLTFTTKVNYLKVDTEKLIDIAAVNSSLIKDGKVKLDDVKEMYEAVGATCRIDK